MKKSVSKMRLSSEVTLKASQDIAKYTITKEERVRIGNTLSNASITLKEHNRGFEGTSSYRLDISDGLAIVEKNRPTINDINAERDANKKKHRLGKIKLGNDP